MAMMGQCFSESPTNTLHKTVHMCAASGSEIQNHGREPIKFRGDDFSKAAAEHRVFTRRA